MDQFSIITVDQFWLDKYNFVNLAGFKYTFEVEVSGENNAKALLKFILPDGNPGDVQSPGKHLSWGEKHSFALILFMFDAIRSKAKLIILDDPISSFDSNKKYAIINRLFKTRERGNSLYERTVLMLTHDFEPVMTIFRRILDGRPRLQFALLILKISEDNSSVHRFKRVTT